jgi:hypothetical protein
MFFPVEVVSVHPMVMPHPTVVEHAPVVPHAVEEAPPARLPVAVSHFFPAAPAHATTVAHTASVAQPAAPLGRTDSHTQALAVTAAVLFVVLLVIVYIRKKK